MIKTPEKYPIQLGNYLNSVASKGLVPGKLYVSSQKIIQEIHEFISFTDKNEQVLICGGANLELNVQLPEALILENRYAEQSEIMSVKINEFSKIIIFSDWISSAVDLNNNFKVISNCISSMQEFYVIELAYFNHEKAIEINCGNANLKWYQYKKWLKFNSSHMHLGYKSYTSEFLRILNLTPDY